jgi:hypothetical protein
LSERAVALVQARDGRRQRAVGVRVLLEDAQDDVECRSPRGCDQRSPLRNSS